MNPCLRYVLRLPFAILFHLFITVITLIVFPAFMIIYRLREYKDILN